jgi:hypothetical protein
MPLTKFELAIVDAIAEHHRRACACHAAKLSIEALAFDVGGVAPRRVRAVVRGLVEMGMLAVRRGSGQRGSQYFEGLAEAHHGGRSAGGCCARWRHAAVLMGVVIAARLCQHAATLAPPFRNRWGSLEG